jgi:DnaJ-class molecular chaperone
VIFRKINTFKNKQLNNSDARMHLMMRQRKMALNYHHDKNNLPGTEERFNDIAEAYEILSDPEKK